MKKVDQGNMKAYERWGGVKLPEREVREASQRRNI